MNHIKNHTIIKQKNSPIIKQKNSPIIKQKNSPIIKQKTSPIIKQKNSAIKICFFDTIINNIILASFSSKNGFDDYTIVATQLLELTNAILDTYNIPYFINFGTLLGYVRHKKFIPWDDDIDITVDEKFISMIPEIIIKYGDKINIIKFNDYLYKFCFKNAGVKIDKNVEFISGNNYNWPFIDLFIMKRNKDIVSYDKRTFKNEYIFPIKKIKFMNVNTYIPNNPDKLLTINYGNDYLKIYKSSPYNHKKEVSIKNRYSITSEKFLDYYNKL